MKLFIAVLTVWMANMAAAERKVCSGDGATLWQFNGERHETTKLPCKYNAVRQTCGPYIITVTPGNVYRMPRYRLDSLWLAIKLDGGPNGESLWEGRTDNKIAVKYFNGWKSNLFNKKNGTAETDDILTFGKDTHSTYAQDKDGFFRVTFTPWDPDNDKFNRSLWIFECFATDNFQAAGYATQLCGGENVKEIAQRREELGMETRDQAVYYDLFTNDVITQTNPKCDETVHFMIDNCTEEQRKLAMKTCTEILGSAKHTRCVTKYSCDPMDVFQSCLTWVCSDFTDNEACEEVGSGIDLCRRFNQGDLTDKVDAAKCFRERLHINSAP